MAKHTQHFTTTIKQHLATGKGQRQKQKWHRQHNQQHHLPDILKLSALRGETYYRQRFFDYFYHKGFDDAFTYMAYQKMYVDNHMIVEFVQQIGLHNITEAYIKKGIANENTDYTTQCHQLYSLLIDYLVQLDEKDMLYHATTGLIQHYLPSYFPKANKIKPSLETLKKQLKKALNTQWHCQVTVKESFTTTDKLATMKLIAHVDKCHPTVLIVVEAKRLRSAKFRAYHELLDHLNNGQFTITPQTKMAKKGQTIEPLKL